MNARPIPKLKNSKGCGIRIGVALGLLVVLGIWIIDTGQITGTRTATFRDKPFRIERAKSWCGFTYRRGQLDFPELEQCYPAQSWRVAVMTYEEPFRLITLPGHHFESNLEAFYWDLATLETYLSHASTLPPQSEVDEFMISFVQRSPDRPTIGTLMERWSAESKRSR